MSQATPSSCTYSMEYTFEPHDSSTTMSGMSVTIESKTNDTGAHRDEAFAQLARMYGLPNAAAARDRWTIDHITVRWANKPWSDWDELERVLKSFSGVNGMRYEDPLEGEYGPPTFHLHVQKGHADAVRSAVKQYYPGLIPKVDSASHVRVLVSPLA